MNVKRNYRVF